MSIGAFLARGGAVLRGINEGNDEADSRAFLARTRESGVKRLDAADTLLPAETVAKGAQAALQTDVATTARRQLPAQAALADTKTEIDQRTSTHTLGHLGTLFDTKDAEMAANLDKAKTGAAAAKFDLEALPGTIAKMKASKTIDDVQTADALLGGLGHALTMGDKAVTQKYLQQMIDTGMNPQLAGKKVGDIGTMPGPDGKPVLVVQDVDGQILMAVPGDKITGAYQRMNPAKYLVIPDGANVLKTTATSADLVFNNPKDLKPADKANHQRLGTNDGIKALDSAYGIKRDPISNMIDSSTIQDKTGYYKDIAEMEKRVQAGESPMAVASDLAEKAQRRQALDRTSGGGGGASTGKKDHSNLWGGK